MTAPTPAHPKRILVIGGSAAGSKAAARVRRDHSVATAHIIENKLRGFMKGMSPNELRLRLESGERPTLLDVRGPDEFTETRLGQGEHLIPLSTLRKRLNELPPDKDQEIICYCRTSLRGYEAARVLAGYGWRNARVLEGGLMAWPYARAK